MSDFGLEVRDTEGGVIIDSSTFTVRQVAKRFISNADLIVKVGRADWTKPVNFPWAESKYGMFISVTQVNLADLPRNPIAEELKSVDREYRGNLTVVDAQSLDRWILDSPRLPVATAYDGYITLAPAVYAFNANVWLSLYVVV